MTTATLEPTRNRRNLKVVALVVAAVLIAVVVGGEMYARHVVRDCLTQQFRQQLSTKVDIGLGIKPVLIEMVDHSIPSFTIDSSDARFGPAQGMKVHAVAHNIHLEDGNKRAGTIGSSDADVVWSSDGIAKTLQEQSLNLISGVRSNPANGTLEFDALNGIGKLEVKPSINGNRVQVDTKDAEVLGFGLPTDLVDGVVKVISDGLQIYPIGMTPKTLQVTDSGIHLTLAGGSFDLPKGTTGSCTTS